MGNTTIKMTRNDFHNESDYIVKTIVGEVKVSGKFESRDKLTKRVNTLIKQVKKNYHDFNERAFRAEVMTKLGEQENLCATWVG